MHCLCLILWEFIGSHLSPTLSCASRTEMRSMFEVKWRRYKVNVCSSNYRLPNALCIIFSRICVCLCVCAGGEPITWALVLCVCVCVSVCTYAQRKSQRVLMCKTCGVPYKGVGNEATTGMPPSLWLTSCRLYVPTHTHTHTHPFDSQDGHDDPDCTTTLCIIINFWLDIARYFVYVGAYTGLFVRCRRKPVRELSRLPNGQPIRPE